MSYVNNMELVSVLIPVYNAAAYLEECLTSVTNQTYPQLEILIYNDGSTDGSLELARNLAQKDARIKVIDGGANQGPGSAKNKLVDLANGYYLTFVDADDRIGPKRIARMVHAIKASNADFIQVDEEHNQLKDDGSSFIYDCSSLKQRLILGGDKGNFTTLWSKIFRRSFLQDNHIRFTEKRMSADDVGYCLKSYAMAQKISFISGDDYYYRKGVANQLTAQIDRLIIGRVKNVVDAISYFLDKDTKINLDPAAASYLALKLTRYLASLRHTSKSSLTDVEKVYREALLSFKAIQECLPLTSKFRYGSCLSIISKIPLPWCFYGLKLLTI